MSVDRQFAAVSGEVLSVPDAYLTEGTFLRGLVNSSYTKDLTDGVYQTKFQLDELKAVISMHQTGIVDDAFIDILDMAGFSSSQSQVGELYCANIQEDFIRNCKSVLPPDHPIHHPYHGMTKLTKEMWDDLRIEDLEYREEPTFFKDAQLVRRCWNELVELKDELSKVLIPEAVIAGEGVLGCLFKIPFVGSEVFICSGAVAKAAVNKVIQNIPDLEMIVRDRHTIHAGSRDDGFQFGDTYYQSTSELVHSFDVDAKCICLDSNGDIWLTRRCLHAITTGVNVFDVERLNPGYELRLAKYGYMGFRILASKFLQSPDSKALKTYYKSVLDVATDSSTTRYMSEVYGIVEAYEIVKVITTERLHNKHRLKGVDILHHFNRCYIKRLGFDVIDAACSPIKSMTNKLSAYETCLPEVVTYLQEAAEIAEDDTDPDEDAVPALVPDVQQILDKIDHRSIGYFDDGTWKIHGIRINPLNKDAARSLDHVWKVPDRFYHDVLSLGIEDEISKEFEFKPYQSSSTKRPVEATIWHISRFTKEQPVRPVRKRTDRNKVLPYRSSYEPFEPTLENRVRREVKNVDMNVLGELLDGGSDSPDERVEDELEEYWK
jgi:hypothetical protein